MNRAEADGLLPSARQPPPIPSFHPFGGIGACARSLAVAGRALSAGAGAARRCVRVCAAARRRRDDALRQDARVRQPRLGVRRGNACNCLRTNRPTAHRPHGHVSVANGALSRTPAGRPRPRGRIRQKNARAAPALRPTHGWAAVVNVLLARRMQTVALKAICTEACGLPARPCHVCAGSGLTQPASLPGIGSVATSAPGLLQVRVFPATRQRDNVR
jgi:hypothetical protein